MSEPWYDPNMFGALFGSIVGGGGGSLAGILGALAGTLAPRGIGRPWILGAMWCFVAVGIALFGLGLYALLMGQPFGIWYGPLLSGVIFTIVVGCLIPVVRMRYRQAEERRLQAEGLRGS